MPSATLTPRKVRSAECGVRNQTRRTIPHSALPTPNSAQSVALLKRVAKSHNLTDESYAHIVEVLGRQPTLTEVGIFGVMHSEHCSYGSSRPYLKLFPTTGERVLVPAGKENAGLIDVGDGIAVAFKVESHNHPSAVEPHEGAATGVGGIIRDIFTMGARPIALLDSLRFGPLSDARTRFLFDGVIRGIADYGNCLAASEQVTIKNSGSAKTVSIGPYVDALFGRKRLARTLEPPHPLEVLSFDPVKHVPRWCRVKRVWRTHADDLLRIKTTMGRSWLVTPDHPSVIVDKGRLVTKPASELKPRDLIPVLTKLPEESILPALDLLSLVETFSTKIYVRLKTPFRADEKKVQEKLRAIEPSAQNRFHYHRLQRMPLRIYLALEEAFGYDRRNVELFLPSGKANYIGCLIPLDTDFARLLGYYLAEGCVSQNGSTYKIIWVFGRSQPDRYYVADLCRIIRRFRWRFSVEWRTSTIAVTVSSWFLGTLLKEIWRCGDRAHTKAVPDLFFRGPRALRIELLKGLWRGDGSVSIRKTGSRVKIALGTTSQALAHQVTLLLQSLGVIPLCYVHTSKPSLIRGKRIKGRRLFSVELNGYRSVRRLQNWFAPAITRKIKNALHSYQFQDLRYSFPRSRVNGPLGVVSVTAITREAAIGPVYDFEVEGTHLFVTTGGLVTHNCVGIPTVGGEILFDGAYRDNPLVNVMCIGIVPKGKIAHAQARGVGNPVLYVGSSTGRDGLGGASFASRELTNGSDADRPAVQIGDPFTEKCLIEATLEALATGDVVGIQDMGAAGLTCSTCEMAARGGCGIEIDVLKVPRRETGMTPYEVMLSESQERMLLIVKRGKEAGIKRIFAKWGLNAMDIGRVTSDGLMRVKEGETIVAEIPARALADEAPIFHRPVRRPRYLAKVQRFTLRAILQPKDFAETLLALLASPSIAEKSYVYEQYDHMVQTNTVALPGRADAAVLRLKGTDTLLAATTDGSGRYCYLDPYEGGKAAVAEAARNLLCVGAVPLAVTDCLNFGNPQDPEIMWQFKECVRGIAEACRAFATPVTGGNVSFYNEGPRGAIDPTPVIGMIGIIKVEGSRLKAEGKSRGALQPSASSLQLPITASFKGEGDSIILLGETREELGGSEYLAVLHHKKAGKPPRVDLAQERALQRLMVEAASSGWLASAHDCSDGGLAVTLAECCIMDGDHLVGVVVSNLQLPTSNFRIDALLFGESAGRIVVSCERRFVEPIQQSARRMGVPSAVIGRVGGSHLRIDPWIDIPVDVLDETWRSGLEKALKGGG